MGKTFYIGDLHFGHEKILWLDNRPFKTVQEMDQALIRNWQDAVTDEDTVIVLGDMFWKTVDKQARAGIMSRLPGRKILIWGNHDDDLADGWSEIYGSVTMLDGGTRVYLNHYPCISFPGFYKGDVHLYAHVHVSFESNLAEHVKSVLEDLYLKPCRMYNVGCMMPWMGYTPRTLEEIEAGYKKFLNGLYGQRKPEIARMLTLSSGHISEETAQKLDREPDTDDMSLCVYEKSAKGGEPYGWYIQVPPDTDPDSIPDDLKRCIEIARAQGCSVLCLDSDGPEYPGLETYDW